MKFKISIRREIKAALALAIVFFFIAFTERKQNTVAVSDVVIKVDNTQENHFLDESDVLDIMELDHENLKGASVGKVNLKEIEKKIKNDRFIQDAELYSDLKGNLVIRVTLHRPVARIIRSDGEDGYIAEDGTIMPVSDKYTSRVILISGAFASTLLKQQKITDSETGTQLFGMLTTIRQDDFWRAQVAQLDIDSKEKITILPQVGNETIEFGAAENVEEKLKKLRIYYKEILPKKGWNKYDRVNLEYEGQIVTE